MIYDQNTMHTQMEAKEKLKTCCWIKQFQSWFWCWPTIHYCDASHCYQVMREPWNILQWSSYDVEICSCWEFPAHVSVSEGLHSSIYVYLQSVTSKTHNVVQQVKPTMWHWPLIMYKSRNNNKVLSYTHVQRPLTHKRFCLPNDNNIELFYTAADLLFFGNWRKKCLYCL